jgi:hypothetical protein
MFQYTPGRPSVARIRGRADAPKSSKKRTCEIESEGVARKRQRKATVADIPKGKSAPPPKKKQKVTNLTDPVLLLRELPPPFILPPAHLKKQLVVTANTLRIVRSRAHWHVAVTRRRRSIFGTAANDFAMLRQNEFVY